MRDAIVISASIIGLFLSSLSFAVQNNTKGGFVDLNIYPYLSDVDSDSVATININTQFDHRISYFSLTNFMNQAESEELQDTTGFYTEQNIRWQIQEGSPLDLTLQMNFRTGDNNDRHRLGFRWRLQDTELIKEFFQAINLSWSMNFHVIQFDSEDADVWQIEHAYRMTFPYISSKLYLSGFIDHTFNQDLPPDYPSAPVVWETQIGYEILNNFFAVAEYRINEYNRRDVNNLALGLEYLIKW